MIKLHLKIRSTKMIKFESVSKQFDDHIAIDDLTFHLEQGAVFGLLGPNGAGKTTLIRMLLDIIKPDTGRILINNDLLKAQDKDNIGYLPEERGLYRNQKVVDILLYLCALKSMHEEDAIRSINYYLTKLDMIEHLDSKVSSLSKGMQQKIQFVSTIAFNPSIVILDEPFSGLDPINIRLMKDLIKELKRKDRTVILSTHQMNQVEALCDSVLIINQGVKIVNGNISDIRKEHSKNEFLIKTNIDLSTLDIVEHIFGEIDNKTHLILKDPYTKEDLLSKLIEIKADIDHFEKRLMPLEDIFIKLVKEHDNK